MSDPASDKMNGSLLIVEAESPAAVRVAIEEDVYWTSNVVSFSSIRLISPPHDLTFPPASLSQWLCLDCVPLYLCSFMSVLVGLSSWCGGV